MSRLTEEREFQIRNDGVLSVDYLVEVLEELDAVRRERDEAIVGAYRAAAEIAVTHWTQGYAEIGYKLMNSCKAVGHSTPIAQVSLKPIADAILSLTPQSALDAVERDRREIAETAILLCKEGSKIHNTHRAWPTIGTWPTADDVLAKVGRGR